MLTSAAPLARRRWRFSILLGALVLAGLATTPRRVTAQAQPLDVLVVITDDMVGAWPTPGMPRVSAMVGDPSQGWIRFDNAYVNTPLCCPSRATVLSGKWAHHHHVVDNSSAGAFDPTSSMAYALDRAGFRTGLFGKYLNNWWLVAGPGAVPPGWDVFKALTVEAQDRYYYDYTASFTGTPRSFGHTASDYSTDMFGTKARTFMHKTAEPFFAYYAPIAPHNPWTAAPTKAGTFASLPVALPPNFNEADVSDKPAWLRAKPLLSAAEQQNQVTHIRMADETLLSVDDQLMAMVSQLMADDRWAHTVVVFLSDNGLGFGSHRIKAKSCVYEECARVPLIIHVPGQMGRVDHTLVSLADIAPTVLDLEGLPIPAGVDGVSLRGLLTGGPGPTRSGVLIEQRVPSDPPTKHWRAIRSGQWLYAEYDNGDRELYDLNADPYQLTSLHADPAYADQRAQLATRLHTLASS